LATLLTGSIVGTVIFFEFLDLFQRFGLVAALGAAVITVNIHHGGFAFGALFELHILFVPYKWLLSQ
jgi:hypothetical protein